MSKKYLVMFEADDGEWLYASAENPFTYQSKPLIFESEVQANSHASKYSTYVVVEQSEINPRKYIRNTIMKGI